MIIPAFTRSLAFSLRTRMMWPRYWRRRREAGYRYRARARRTCWGSRDQVPAQLVYLTDGPAHRVKIGAQTIQLKPARPSRFPGAGTPAGLALQAIRAAGPNANKDFVVRQLSRALSARDRAQLAKLIKHAPAWSHEIIRRLKTSISSSTAINSASTMARITAPAGK